MHGSISAIIQKDCELMFVTPTRYSPPVSLFPCVEIIAGQEGYEKCSLRRGRVAGTNLVRIAPRFVPAPVLRQNALETAATASRLASMFTCV